MRTCVTVVALALCFCQPGQARGQAGRPLPMPRPTFRPLPMPMPSPSFKGGGPPVTPGPAGPSRAGGDDDMLWWVGLVAAGLAGLAVVCWLVKPAQGGLPVPPPDLIRSEAEVRCRTETARRRLA